MAGLGYLNSTCSQPKKERKVIQTLRIDLADNGSVLPLTHFLQLVRGIMLKGNVFAELWPNIWPIIVFMSAMIGIGLLVYRRTLD